MKRIIIFSMILLLIIVLRVYGQKGDYNWLITTSAGITFNTPNLEPRIENFKLTFGQVFSVISDCNGNLLFSTHSDGFCDDREWMDEVKIFDKTHTPFFSHCNYVMLGHILIPYPESNSLFCHVFTEWIDSLAPTKYRTTIQILDRTKRNGLGDVIGEIKLPNHLFGITKSSDGKKWWITTIYVDTNTNSSSGWPYIYRLKNYLLSKEGITDSNIVYLPESIDSIFRVSHYFFYPFILNYEREVSDLLLIPFSVKEYFGEEWSPGQRLLSLYKIRMGILSFDPEVGKCEYIGSFLICDSCGLMCYLMDRSCFPKIYVGILDKQYKVPEKDSIYRWEFQLLQFTYSTDMSEIEKSRTQVGPTKGFSFILRDPFEDELPEDAFYYDLKTGPNGKLYILHYPFNFISEISNPRADPDEIIYIDTALVFDKPLFGIFPHTSKTSSCLGRIDVWLPDTVVKIGTKNFCIPIYAQKKDEIVEGIDFEIKIRFDAKAFLPVNVDSKIESGDRIVKITGKSEVISDEAKVIGWICGDVLLGSKSRVPLKIESFQWKDSYIETETHDGSLTIVGVCEPELLQIELLNPINIIVHPNPVYSNEVEIVVEGLKGMNYLLEIYNSRGMVVEREGIYMEDSVAVIRKSLTSYPNGLYLFKVGTQSLVIVKI